jgi:CheY-like chemotaxis protein
MVFAYADSTHAVLCCRQLRRLGWEVHLTRSGPEARRLARSLQPATVVLDIDLHDESGWLTCAKLTQEQPNLRVVLVTGATMSDLSCQRAHHAGAATLVHRTDGATALVGDLSGRPIPTAS